MKVSIAQSLSLARLSPLQRNCIFGVSSLALLALAGTFLYGAPGQTLQIARQVILPISTAIAPIPQLPEAFGPKGNNVTILPQAIDLEQQLAPRYYVLSQGYTDGLLEGNSPSLVMPEAAETFDAQPVEQIVEVPRGATMYDVLTEAGVVESEAKLAAEALEKQYPSRNLKAGQEVKLVIGPAISTTEGDIAEGVSLMSLSLQQDAERIVQLNRAESGEFTASVREVALSAAARHVVSDIQSSLFYSAKKHDIPLSTMQNVIQAFSYDVDFARDIKAGDRFEILYETLSDEHGNIVKSGQVSFASLVLSGKTIALYRFTPEGGSPAYYSPEGETVRRALLRTPIDGARVTSGFGLRRHPILGYSKMHKGMDFGAPTGTPIFAAGDGTIEILGRRGAYGNYVRIKHSNTYSTAYAHISKFAKGMKSGTKVKQGQIIAYVGSTGRSTGPHLHFEVLQSGKQINPASVKALKGDGKLKGKDLAAFKKFKMEIDAQRKAGGQIRTAAVTN